MITTEEWMRPTFGSAPDCQICYRNYDCDKKITFHAMENYSMVTEVPLTYSNCFFIFLIWPILNAALAYLWS